MIKSLKNDNKNNIRNINISKKNYKNIFGTV